MQAIKCRKGRPSREAHYDWLCLLEYYRDSIAPDGTVLEIGASETNLTRELAHYCGQLIGVELFPERTPSGFDNIQYITGDWQSLSSVVKPQSIDFAVASHVIEHVPDDSKAIEELYTVLKPGGMAVLTTPNRRRLARVLIELFTGKRKFPFWEHQREYIEEDLVALIESSRFEEYCIVPRVLGLHGGPLFVYFEEVPEKFRKYANFWEIRLRRTSG